MLLVGFRSKPTPLSGGDTFMHVIALLQLFLRTQTPDRVGRSKLAIVVSRGVGTRHV
jgi:hypothetical protein